MKSTIEINSTTFIGFEELSWRFSRSGGPGGQNVNKVETRVTLIFNIQESRYLSSFQKLRIIEKLGKSIDGNGNLRIDVDQERSQIRNREIAIERFSLRLRQALRVTHQRKKTKMPQKVKELRLKEKKRRSQQKQDRKKGDITKDIL